MLLGGDEIARTQGGNNNAWCQDNEISWYDWDLHPAQCEQLEFARRLIAFRRDHPAFRRREFLEGRATEGSGLPDVWWFRPDGRRMTRRDWQQEEAHVLGVFLNGDEIADHTSHGDPVYDDSFLLLFNAHYEEVPFTLPVRRFGAAWTHELCTADPAIASGSGRFPARGQVTVTARSLKVLRRIG